MNHRVGRFLAAFVALTSAIAGPGNSDVLFRGEKAVSHEVAFLGIARFDGLDFYLVAPEGWGMRCPPRRLAEGEPVSFYKLLAMKVCAAPKGADLTESGLVDQSSDWRATSSTSFQLRVTAPETDSVARRLSIYRIDDVADGQIAVVDLGTEEWDLLGNPISRAMQGERAARTIHFTGTPLWISFLAAVGILGFLIFRRPI